MASLGRYPTKVVEGPREGLGVGGFGGMGEARGRRDIGGAGESISPWKVRLQPMHDALVALLLMAIVMFPCFFTMGAPE